MTEFEVPTVLVERDNDSEHKIPVALQKYHVRERVEGDR